RFPASGENVIAVGATTASDGKATFSNTGPELDVVAPGQGIYSTNSSGGYGAYSGTSYASPHVAALAALIMTANPGLTNQQVVDIITSTAKDLGTAGWDQTYGWGRIQADAALQKAITTTPQPSPTPTPTPTSTPTPTPSDTTNPQTSITSPTDGATVSGTTTISASASDDASVSSVSLFIDGVFAGEDTSSPYTYSWDTTKETNGNHTIQSKALDTSSNLGESTIITVNVNNPSPPSPTPTATPTSTPTATPVATVAPELPDTTPPTVSITYPTDGSNITGGSKINITASAQDNVSVSKVEIYVNNKLKCRDYASPYSCSWNVPAASGKTYQIQAKAYDSSNNASPFSTITVKAL
ncbi:S8 family serine peptidase, partial [Candidatus Microgenomates bacterium]|nr:S8 family serine peptidase [Candidatus Microgenomates bacterium]